MSTLGTVRLGTVTPAAAAQLHPFVDACSRGRIAANAGLTDGCLAQVALASSDDPRCTQSALGNAVIEWVRALVG